MTGAGRGGDPDALPRAVQVSASHDTEAPWLAGDTSSSGPGLPPPRRDPAVLERLLRRVDPESPLGVHLRDELMRLRVRGH